MKIKVADYIINYLADLGIKKAFLVYGSANGDLVDAFVRNDKIEYVCVMNEQGGGFAAEGYAKTTRNFGVAIATSGPGGMNLVTCAGNCWYDSVPCLFITGQIINKYLRPTEEIRQVGFQEADMVSIFKPITKYAVMINKAEDVRYELEKALYLMKEGRPGPVLLDIPLNIQKQEVETDTLVGYNKDAQKSYDHLKLIKLANEFLDDLQKSKRPCVLVGNGVKLAKAEEDLYRVCDVLKIPVFPTWNAIDTVASDYQYYGGRVGTYGGPGRNFGIQNCDLLLCIGSRLSGRITGGNVNSFARGAKRYLVDVDAPALQQHLQQLPFHTCILSDAKLFLETLLSCVLQRVKFNYSPDSIPDFSEWTNRVLEWRDKYDPVLPEMFEDANTVHPYAFMRLLSEQMRDDIILGDCGGNIVVLNHTFKTKIGQTHITNNGNSPMGFAMCGAIGASFASHPNQNVVCVIGDGGMCMNLQELQTIANYRKELQNLKIIILNNHIYGITKAFQKVNFEGRFEACGPKGYIPPNFAEIAHAFHLRYKYIEYNNVDYLNRRIKEVLEMTGPVICEVNCFEYHSYNPKVIGWATSIEDMYPYLPDEEFYSNMIIEPLPREKFQPTNLT